MKDEVMKNLCTNCEKETEMEVIVKEETIEIKKDSIKVLVRYLKCKECNDEVLSPIHGEDPFALAYMQYRKKHGLLSPEEIRDYRETLGITQMELAKLLGLGLATVNRYENGSLQDVSHDNLLRLAMDPNNIVKLLEKSENIFDKSRKEALVQSIIDLQKTKIWFCLHLVSPRFIIPSKALREAVSLIRQLTSLIRRIVGRIIMKDWHLAFGAMALPIAFTLITVKAVSENAPVILYWLGGFCGILGLIAFVVALKRASTEDKKLKKESDELSQVFKDLRGETKDINKNINTLIQEMRQERNERKRK